MLRFCYYVLPVTANLASGVGEIIAFEDPSQTAEEAEQRGSFLEGLRGLYQLYKRDFGSDAEPVAQEMPSDDEIINVLEEQSTGIVAEHSDK